MLAKTTEDALALWHDAKERQLEMSAGSADYERLGVAIMELEQVVSILSDAELANPDAMTRAKEAVDEARAVIAEVAEP